jgi:glutamine synthetase
MTQKMVAGGIDIEKHHHEVATGGQVEFGMRFNTLLKQADSVMLYKYIAKNVAVPERLHRHLHAQTAFPG